MREIFVHQRNRLFRFEQSASQVTAAGKGMHFRLVVEILEPLALELIHYLVILRLENKNTSFPIDQVTAG